MCQTLPPLLVSELGRGQALVQPSRQCHPRLAVLGLPARVRTPAHLRWGLVLAQVAGLLSSLLCQTRPGAAERSF